MFERLDQGLEIVTVQIYSTTRAKQCHHTPRKSTYIPPIKHSGGSKVQKGCRRSNTLRRAQGEGLKQQGYSSFFSLQIITLFMFPSHRVATTLKILDTNTHSDVLKSQNVYCFQYSCRLHSQTQGQGRKNKLARPRRAH